MLATASEYELHEQYSGDLVMHVDRCFERRSVPFTERVQPPASRRDTGTGDAAVLCHRTCKAFGYDSLLSLTEQTPPPLDK